MLKFFIFISGLMVCNSCATKNNIVTIHGEQETADSVIYELIITEPGYDAWAVTNAKPDWYHEKEYNRNWNFIYVTEFNHRVLHTSIGHPFNEVIRYDPQTDYGKELEYKLYWYFKYIEYKYNTNLHISAR